MKTLFELYLKTVGYDINNYYKIIKKLQSSTPD
jgi:hypothetical protein